MMSRQAQNDTTDRAPENGNIFQAHGKSTLNSVSRDLENGGANAAANVENKAGNIKVSMRAPHESQPQQNEEQHRDDSDDGSSKKANKKPGFGTRVKNGAKEGIAYAAEQVEGVAFAIRAAVKPETVQIPPHATSGQRRRSGDSRQAL